MNIVFRSSFDGITPAELLIIVTFDEPGAAELSTALQAAGLMEAAS